MSKKIICFIGLGGAGQRHLRLLDKINKQKIFFKAVRKIKKVETISENFQLEDIPLVEKFKNLNLSKNYSEAIKTSETIFICNHTSGHFKIANKSAESKKAIFVEKPFYSKKKLFLNFIKRIERNKKRFLIGYQRRFHPLFIKFKSLIKKDKNKIYKVIVNVNSYVPYWHKYEDYKKLYACKKILGGGALMTECHEIDLIIGLFGVPKSLICKKKYNKKLKIDVETGYQMRFDYHSFSVFFKINMFNKNLKRELVVFNGNTYKLDLHKGLIEKKIVKTKIIKGKKLDNDLQFKNQIKYFFSKRYSLKNSLIQAKSNFKIFDAALKSVKYKKAISL